MTPARAETTTTRGRFSAATIPTTRLTASTSRTEVPPNFITTMAETPGVGTRVKDAGFTSQFEGLGPDAVVKVKKDGGEIDAVSGATISSRAVTLAIEKARAFYDEHAAAIQEAASQQPEAAE